MYSFPDLEPVCSSMSGSNCCFLTCTQISQEAGHVVWYSHPLKIQLGHGVSLLLDLTGFILLRNFVLKPVSEGEMESFFLVSLLSYLGQVHTVLMEWAGHDWVDFMWQLRILASPLRWHPLSWPPMALPAGTYAPLTPCHWWGWGRWLASDE